MRYIKKTPPSFSTVRVCKWANLPLSLALTSVTLRNIYVLSLFPKTNTNSSHLSLFVPYVASLSFAHNIANKKKTNAKRDKSTVRCMAGMQGGCEGEEKFNMVRKMISLLIFRFAK